MEKKKLTRKEKAELQKSQSQAKQVEKKAPSKGSLKWTLALVIAVAGFLLYANTLGHDYALDDFSVIKENRLTKEGWHAFPEILKRSFRYGYITTQDELYRPVPKALFAIQWALSPDNASLGHWMNVLLYAFTGMLLFFTLYKYLKKNLIVPFVASLLFIAHPIHTEAVANIKSIDEMLSFFFAVLAMNFLHTALVKGKGLYMFGAMAAFMLSLLSKESGITFMAVFPLAIYFFTDVPLKKNLTTVLYMCIPVGIFLLLRHNVLAGSLKTNFSEVDNYLVAAPNGAVKLATAIFILGLYLKLLFFPHPLVIDYSFKELPFVGMGDWQFWVSILVYAALIVIAIRGFKKKDGIAFSILYFLITLSIFSNILITIGTSFGERLMLIPSLGFCLALAFAGAKWLPAAQKNFETAKDFFSANAKLMALCGVVVVLYGFKTIDRNGDWADNYSIFSTDVKVSTKSAHMHNYFGNLLSKPENLGRKDSATVALTYDTAIVELKRAIEIFPKYADCYNQMGVIYYRKKAYKDAYDCYTKAIEYNNTNAVFHNNIGTMFFDTHDYQNALKAIQRAVELDPNYTDALANLASTYGTLKDFDNALIYLHRCIKVDPNYTNAYYFLSITYGNLGDKANADLYMAKYQKVKKETESKGVPGIGD